MKSSESGNGGSDQEDRVIEDEEEDPEYKKGRDRGDDFPVKALPPSMRIKVSSVIAVYLCTMGLVTFYSQSLIGQTMVLMLHGLSDAVESAAFPEVMVWETYIISREVGKYDWSDIVARFEEAEGVSRVRFGGSLNANFAVNQEVPVSDDDVMVFFGHAGVPYRLWGDKIGSDWGRELREKDEIVVGKFTAEKYGKGIGEVIEFFGLNFTIVGISRAETKAMGEPYPLIMIDYSHMHRAVAYLQGIAEAQEVLHPEWFMSDFHLEVFARGYRDREIAANAILPLRQELESAS